MMITSRNPLNLENEPFVGMWSDRPQYTTQSSLADYSIPDPKDYSSVSLSNPYRRGFWQR